MVTKPERPIEGLSHTGSGPSQNERTGLERQVSTRIHARVVPFLEFSIVIQDQPVPQTSAFTRFAVNSDQLKSTARAISLPSRSSGTIAMTLSTNKLRLNESTTDSGFSVARTIVPVRPLDLAEGETVSFEIPKRFLSSWGQHYDCELSFEMDKDQNTLAWHALGRSFHVRAPIRFIASPDCAEKLHHLATLHSRVLYDAIGHSALLIDKRTANTQAFDGLEISGGSAKSGYLGGVSLYKSAVLPDTLRFVLPKRNVANALAAIGKMQGPVDVTETERAVFIKSENAELRWSKAGLCRSLDRIFSTPTEATFNVIVDEARNSVLIASIGSDRGRIILEKSDQDLSLSLLSIAPAARYEVAFKGQFRESNLEPGTKLAFTVNLVDLSRVLLSVRTSDAEISIGKQFLIVKSSCAEYDEISVLAGLD